EIDLLEGGVFFAKQTLRFAARCSSGFQVELQHETMVAGRRRRLDANPVQARSFATAAKFEPVPALRIVFQLGDNTRLSASEN
ncbi:MAG: hypothetical protein WB359_20320, partial [Bryobacteraceae bacterium]